MRTQIAVCPFGRGQLVADGAAAHASPARVPLRSGDLAGRLDDRLCLGRGLWTVRPQGATRTSCVGSGH